MTMKLLSQQITFTTTTVSKICRKEFASTNADKMEDATSRYGSAVANQLADVIKIYYMFSCNYFSLHINC